MSPTTTLPVSNVSARPEPRLTENGRKVLEARYLKKNESGEPVESPGDLFSRVARTIADVETMYGATEVERRQWEERFYRVMASGEFMPNSPTLMNAGREMGMLSACFVLPVRDSIVDIFNSIKHTALIQKAGGGTGFAFDELRPTGDFIQSSGGTTSGPITFWRAFSEATNAIQQGAFRRGANMGMMYIHHPDILKFLHAKQDLSQFTNYNISVKVTDDWMDEFLASPDSPHVVRNPRNGKCFVLPREIDIWKSDVRQLIEIDCVTPVAPGAPEKYFRSPRLTGPLPASVGKVYSKREVWNIIIQNAWQTGEPGVVFIDRINEHNPTPHVGRIEATNPCGEQPLLPYEACNLGSVNVGAFVKNPCSPRAEMDWDGLRDCIHMSTRFLDNVIDANNYPLDEIDQICKSNRKIGLGVMGFSDMLYGLGVAYNSAEGVAWGERIMKFLNDEAHNYSEHLARCRGCFPNWKGSIWQTKHNRMMRNSATTTVAPTGTISIIANCSGGIEPMFSLAFLRNVLKGQKQGEKPLVEVNDTFLAASKQRGFHSDELIERIARAGTVAHEEDVPEDARRVFVCAHDITPEWHMKMQAAFQRHCDASISKTINFPQAATRDDVEQIYRLAYEMECKGVTVYRDGCRSCQPMALKKEEPRSEGTKEQSGPAIEGLRDQGIKKPEGGPREKAEDGGGTMQAEIGALGSGNGNGNGNGNGKGHAHEKTAGTTAATPIVSAAMSADAAVAPAVAVEAAPAPAGLTRITNIAPSVPLMEPRDLPEIVSGFRIKQMTPFGNMHVKITVDPRSERELEIFAQLGKGGDVANSDLEGMCRTASLWLRAGGSLRHLIKQWEGIGSSLQIPTRTGRIMSLPDGLASALKKYARAKERFGLRSMLLGEIDPAELDNPFAAPQRAHAAAVDRAVNLATSAPSVVAALPAIIAPPPASVAAAGGNGGGSGNGNGGAHGNGHSGGSGASHGIAASRLAGAADRAASVIVSEVRPASDGRREVIGPLAAVAAPGMTVSSAAVGAMVAPTVADAGAGTGAVSESAARATAVMELSALDRRLLMATQMDDETAGDPALDIGNSMDALADEVMPSHRHNPASHYKLICPECQGHLAQQEGCQKCPNCGWAAC